MASKAPIHTILIVDNNPALVAYLGEFLTGRGYQVLTASTGLKALNLIRKRVPDLAIVDRIMPELDGDELCRLIRSDERSRSMFLIMLSAIAVEDPIPPAGMLVDAYLAKAPLRELRNTIPRVISDLEAGNTAKYTDSVVGVDSLYRREITVELLESKRHLEAFLETTPNGVIELNAEHIIVRANERARELLGATDSQLLSRDFHSLLAGVVPEQTLNTFTSRDAAEYRRIGEDNPVTLNDRFLIFTSRIVKTPLSPSLLVIIEDVSHLHSSYQRVQQLLEEKQQLLREVQHRIKNNLASISSMLNLAAGRAESDEAREALQASDTQVKTVLRLHETLNSGGEYRNVEITGFLRSLCGETQSLYPSHHYHLSCQIPDEQIVVPVGTALPLGLMVNELITNAFKHSSVAERETTAEVEVQMDRPDDSHVRIQVSDNGPGLPGGSLETTTKGLGLQIVAAQAEQLDAQLSAYNDETGTCFEILIAEPDN